MSAVHTDLRLSLPLQALRWPLHSGVTSLLWPLKVHNKIIFKRLMEYCAIPVQDVSFGLFSPHGPKKICIQTFTQKMVQVFHENLISSIMRLNYENHVFA